MDLEVFDLAIELRPDFLLQLGLAALLGGVVGLEREINGKPAGFRTNLLICVGAALITSLSISLAVTANVQEQFAAAAQGRATRLVADPARLAAQIVSGIGFLGAGTIMQARGSVTGLTTAATLWVVAAIGIAVGAAAYEEAIGTAALVMGALILLGKIERVLVRSRLTRTIRVRLSPDIEVLNDVIGELESAGYEVITEDLERTDDVFIAMLQITGRRRRLEETLRLLIEMPGVRQISQP